MSQSDSDLDFESADEDADFVSNTRSKVSQKSASNDEPSESFSTKSNASQAFGKETSTNNLETGTNKDEYINTSSEDNCSSVLKETVEESVKHEIGDLSRDSKVPETDSSSNLEQDGYNVDASFNAPTTSDPKSDSSDAVSHQKVPTTECASELQSDKSLQKHDQQIEESKTRRERVVLRLEKKKQLSKESPIENKIPKDSVKIVEDINENKVST